MVMHSARSRCRGCARFRELPWHRSVAPRTQEFEITLHADLPQAVILGIAVGLARRAMLIARWLRVRDVPRDAALHGVRNDRWPGEGSLRTDIFSPTFLTSAILDGWCWPNSAMRVEMVPMPHDEHLAVRPSSDVSALYWLVQAATASKAASMMVFTASASA
jgi:hypothetical protein